MSSLLLVHYSIVVFLQFKSSPVRRLPLPGHPHPSLPVFERPRFNAITLQIF